MTDSTLFSGSSNEPAVQPTTTNQPTGDLSASVGILVGEGRKYKDLDALAKGHLNADEHISRLETENRELREKAKTQATLDEAIAKLTATQSKPNDQGSNQPGTPPTLDASAVQKLVADTVTGLETARTKQVNLAQAEAALRSFYGDKAGEVLAKFAPTPEERAVLKQLGEVSPEKLVALLKPADKAMPPMQQGTVNGGAPANTDRAGDPGTKEYWDNMRRKEPAKYYSQAMQLERDKVARANPDKFLGRAK
jgi:hypothetical protein